MGAHRAEVPQEAVDELRMMELVRFTARTLETASPVPFGAMIVDTATGTLLMRAVNAVRQENDLSSHAQLRTVRKAARKLKSPSLKGYTLYTTCEPCPMCMGNALWAGLDRVVYGATIADANRHCKQIRVAARKLAKRSDMECTVAGPVLRKACYALFTHPKMLETVVFIFQDATLLPWRTVQANVARGLELEGVPCHLRRRRGTPIHTSTARERRLPSPANL